MDENGIRWTMTDREAREFAERIAQHHRRQLQAWKDAAAEQRDARRLGWAVFLAVVAIVLVKALT